MNKKITLNELKRLVKSEIKKIKSQKSGIAEQVFDIKMDTYFSGADGDLIEEAGYTQMLNALQNAIEVMKAEKRKYDSVSGNTTPSLNEKMKCLTAITEVFYNLSYMAKTFSSNTDDAYEFLYDEIFGHGKGIFKEGRLNSDAIQTLRVGGKSLSVYYIAKPFKDYIYVEDSKGEPYIDVSTILPDNPLRNAVWVKVGGEEEQIANKLTILKPTNKTRKSGYNLYKIYDIK